MVDKTLVSRLRTVELLHDIANSGSSGLIPWKVETLTFTPTGAGIEI